MLLIIAVVKQKRGSKGSKIRGKWREMRGFGRQGGMRVRGE